MTDGEPNPCPSYTVLLAPIEVNSHAGSQITSTRLFRHSGSTILVQGVFPIPRIETARVFFFTNSQFPQPPRHLLHIYPNYPLRRY